MATYDMSDFTTIGQPRGKAYFIFDKETIANFLDFCNINKKDNMIGLQIEFYENDATSNWIELTEEEVHSSRLLICDKIENNHCFLPIRSYKNNFNNISTSLIKEWKEKNKDRKDVYMVYIE
ncbi:hypothetical protein [Clostridium sp. JS66]|uniref:hypothetical protein n=1 Tax=Clostridium sp. JS66 TaxID=3064705 RepID=UPI00298E58FB|nr:hypothetical protein [Clostridium sp. JS66]WPC42916.1 hypothetical protein Q6H37_05445 [Clostridium sp. JS66]